MWVVGGGGIVSKCILEKVGKGGRELDSYDSGQRPVVDTCERGNEISVQYNVGNFFD
jgi:hypothetical protein